MQRVEAPGRRGGVRRLLEQVFTVFPPSYPESVMAELFFSYLEGPRAFHLFREGELVFDEPVEIDGFLAFSTNRVLVVDGRVVVRGFGFERFPGRVVYPIISAGGVELTRCFREWLPALGHRSLVKALDHAVSSIALALRSPVRETLFSGRYRAYVGNETLNVFEELLVYADVSQNAVVEGMVGAEKPVLDLGKPYLPLELLYLDVAAGRAVFHAFHNVEREGYARVEGGATMRVWYKRPVYREGVVGHEGVLEERLRREYARWANMDGDPVAGGAAERLATRVRGIVSVFRGLVKKAYRGVILYVASGNRGA